MPTIRYIEADGTEYDVSASVGDTVMSAAVGEGVEGIVAECGGGCACATCHCFIDDSWLDKTGTAESFENELLDSTTTPRQKGSRLSCQIAITEELDGLVVRLPEVQ